MEIFQHFYAQSASMAQMDHGWNLDIGELAYSPSARDLSDAKVHHMLSEELWKPYRRVSLNSRGLNRMCRMYLPWKCFVIQSSRRLSYSRHAVNDHDLSSSHHVNHNMHMHIRRMVSETVRKQHSKRVKRHRVWTITTQKFQGSPYTTHEHFSSSRIRTQTEAEKVVPGMAQNLFRSNRSKKMAWRKNYMMVIFLCLFWLCIL